jgi:glucose/arabinose dehydrogenase
VGPTPDGGDAGGGDAGATDAGPVTNDDVVDFVTLPDGWRIVRYATSLGHARFMQVAENGDLFVSVPSQGKILVLPDRDPADGRADATHVFAQDLSSVHGLAFHGGFLYAAQTGRVVRFPYAAGDLAASAAPTVIVPDLPDDGGHWTRTLEFGADGRLYISVGSSCNVCVETNERRAGVTRCNADGTSCAVFARGLRNSVGLCFHPDSGELFATENGRDWLGDDWPPEEVNHLQEGKHYGWPRCHGDGTLDPDFGDATFCATTEHPAVKMQAHSAPLGCEFFEGALFVAFHGSWNRSTPTGYKVVRIPFSGGAPSGGPEDFATGFLNGTTVHGRPVDLVKRPGGGLYLSDDNADTVYLIYRP